MIVRAALFDLDGTLVDSLEDLTDAVNHIRNAFSHPPLTAAAVRLKIGKGVRNLVQQTLPGATAADIDSAVGLFLEYNRHHLVDKSRLYPGINDVLHSLAARDIRMAVITNKNEDLSVQMLHDLGIKTFFSCISGGNTYPENKPSPLPLLKTSEALGVPHHECVMIGDSNNDIHAGQRAGIATIGCTWGYGSSEELSGADACAASPRELLTLISAGLR